MERLFNMQNVKEHIMKKISIIIPCFNAEKYIDKCLDSLVNQTIGVENMDIIVVDDASTDSSVKHIMKYQRLYSGSIHLIRRSVNSGQAIARNIGMDNAKADFLAFVDADDWVEHDYYETILEPAEKYHCDIIGCGYIEHVGGQVRDHKLNGPERLYKMDDDNSRKEFLCQQGSSSGIWSKLYRLQYLKENSIRFSDFRKYEDNYWDGMIRYTFKSYYVLPICKYHYQRHEGSNSLNRNDTKHFERLKIEMEKMKYYRETGLFHRYYEDIRNNFLLTFYENTLHIICCQFDYFPLDVVEMMQEIVKEIYPDYLEYYWERRKNNEMGSIITAAFRFPLETWQYYKEAYWEFGCMIDSSKLLNFHQQMEIALKKENKMSLNGQELLNYACGQFEKGIYDAALEAFILAYAKGVEKEWILDNIYNCYMTGNEDEFRKAYESIYANDIFYEECILDFIPYRDGEYYIFDKEIQKFRGIFSLKNVTNAERQECLEKNEFSALAVAFDWDWSKQPDILKEAGYRKVYVVSEDKNRCLSFFKIPELKEYARSIMIFSDVDEFQQYFHKYTAEYLPRMYAGTSDEQQQRLIEAVEQEHAYRLTPEGRNTDNVLLTIAIPSWHRGNCVLKRLENLLPMIYDAEIEITISKNGTGVYEEEYAKAGQAGDARLLYYDHGRDLVYWENWLYAVGMAHGKYVMFVSDEDDVVLGALEHYFKILTDYPELNVVRAKTAFQYGYISDRSYGKKGVNAFINFFLKQNYLSGLMVRRDDFIREDFMRLKQFEDNAFFASYPHEWWCAVLSQKGDNVIEPVILIQEKDGVPQNASEVVINGYATYEGRLQQFQGRVEFLQWMMDGNTEGVTAGLDITIRKTIYLLEMARGYGYDIEHYEEWVDKFCRMAMDAIDVFDLNEEQKLKLLLTLQYACTDALKKYQA